MKTGPKPFRLKEYSFLDGEYSFDEILNIIKTRLITRAKISIKCKCCGKIENLNADRFIKRNAVKCRVCYMKDHLDYDLLIKTRMEKQKETLEQKYGVKNSWQCPSSTEKRLEATSSKESKLKKSETFKNHTDEFRRKTREKTEATIIKNWGSLENHYAKKYEKYSRTCMERYGVSNYRVLCRTKRIKYEGQTFDSTWELAFFLWHKNQNHNIIREPVKLEFIYENKKHYCFPDFEVDGVLYEIKGDYFFNELGEMINPYNRNLDGLYEAKHKCMLEHGVKFISGSEVENMLDLLPDEYKNSVTL